MCQKNLSRNPSATSDTILESQLLNFWLTTIALFFQNGMRTGFPGIRRKRFYRNFILINKTLLLAHLFIHVCFSTIMLAKAKKQEHRYISIFCFFVFCCIIQTKHSGKQNHRSLPESVLKSLLCPSIVNALVVMPYFHYFSPAWSNAASFRLNKINKKVVDSSIFLAREGNCSIYIFTDKDISLLTFKALSNIDLKFKWQITFILITPKSS